MDKVEAFTDQEDWFEFMREAHVKLHPFISTPGSAQACLDNSQLRDELVDAGALVKVKNRWYGHTRRFLTVLGVK